MRVYWIGKSTTNKQMLRNVWKPTDTGFSANIYEMSRQIRKITAASCLNQCSFYNAYSAPQSRVGQASSWERVLEWFGRLPAGLHPDRTIGCDRNHCDSGQHAP